MHTYPYNFLYVYTYAIFVLSDACLKRAFMKVAQSEQASSDWRHLAQRLGLTETELHHVETTYSAQRDRCYQALLLWQQRKEDDASVEKLVRKLRRWRYTHVAG